MASIPLPALSIQPPKQTDPLEAMSRVLQLRSMQGSQDLQQEQLRGAQMENHQRELAESDEENARQAFAQWDGKNTDGLLSLMQRSGVGPKTFTSMASGLLDMKQKAAKLSTDELANETTMHDQARGAIMSVLQAPPNLQQQAWQKMKADALANPAYAPFKQTVNQLPDQYPGNDEAKIMAKCRRVGFRACKRRDRG